MKIYISGKITGLDPKRAWMNFLSVEMRYFKKGINTVNPMNKKYLFNRIGKMPWYVYMACDIFLLLSCDTIYMQYNWKESRGSRIEHGIAKFLNYKIIYGKTNRNNRKAIKGKRK